ncbi:MAG: DivIVA domain-containing protein [Armatimonadetes bacterium]|nr:DivIVA domain-containing protein [Armatimonadota bacterium]
MKITPIDIIHQKFGHAFRGYNEKEVDDFLDEVLKSFEEITEENNHLKEKITILEERLGHFQNLEESLQKAILTAQKTADELLENKKREAEILIKNASLQTKEILEEEKTEIKKLKEEIEALKKRRDGFILEFKNLLKINLDFLEESKLSRLEKD